MKKIATMFKVIFKVDSKVLITKNLFSAGFRNFQVKFAIKMSKF